MPNVNVMKFPQTRGKPQHERFSRFRRKEGSLCGEESGRAVSLFSVQFDVYFGCCAGVGLGSCVYANQVALLVPDRNGFL